MNYDKLLAAYLADGGKITVVPPREVRRHNPYTKSHRHGGRFSAYNVGGNNRVRASRKSA